MKKRVSDNVWIPFWVDKWIFGSMRIEFEPEERAIWLDLLALGAKDDGFIRANEDTPYPIRQLAGMLLIDGELLERTIGKLIKKSKLEKLSNGTLYIKTWKKYQLTKRHQRRYEIPEEDNESEEEDIVSEKRVTKSNQIKSNQIIINNKEYVFLTNLLIEKMKDNDPKAKVPLNETTQYFKWVNNIRLCIEKDGRSQDEIKEAILFSQNNYFWKANILSTAKLREKMPTLLLKLKAEADKPSITGKKEETSEEFTRRQKEALKER